MKNFAIDFGSPQAVALLNAYQEKWGRRAIVIAAEIELLELMEEFPTGDEPRTEDGSETLNAQRLRSLRSLGEPFEPWTATDLRALVEYGLDDPELDDEALADDRRMQQLGFGTSAA